MDFDEQGSRLAHIPTGSTTTIGIEKQILDGMVNNRDTT